MIREYVIHPEDFGMAMASNRSMRVANAEESKGLLLEALDDIPGTPREIVVLNAGAALYVTGIAATIGDGIDRARAAIASGEARRRLDLFVETTRSLAQEGRAGE